MSRRDRRDRDPAREREKDIEEMKKKWAIDHKHVLYLQAKPDVIERLANDRSFEDIVVGTLCRVVVAVTTPGQKEPKKVGRIGNITAVSKGEPYKLHCGGLTEKHILVEYEGRKKTLKLADVSGMPISPAEFAAWKDSLARRGGIPPNPEQIKYKRQQFRDYMKRKRDEPPPLQLENKQPKLDPAAALSALAKAGMPTGPGAGMALGMSPLGLLAPPPQMPGNAPPVLTPEHQTLVHKIKQAQKSSQNWKDKWAEYIEVKSGSKLRDPARHDMAFLKAAIADIGDPDTAIAEGDVAGSGHLAATEGEWDEFYNRLDERARASLDNLPRVVRDMIKRRIMQGGLGGIRNASAVLMGKIRAAEDAAGGAANLEAQAEKVARELEGKSAAA